MSEREAVRGREIKRIQYPALEGFAEHVRQNEPAVLVGVGEHLPLEIFRLTPETMAARVGQMEFPVHSTDTGFLSYERDTAKLKFDDFVEQTFRHEQGKTKLYFKNATKTLPPGIDDSEKIVGLEQFFVKGVVRNLWISRGTITVGLHFDPAENLNIQIRGRKRFSLYPPGVVGYYPCPMFSQSAHMSEVFRQGPDLDAKRFPLFDPSKVREVILEEGEILYLPAYWWHQVTSLGDVNINLNTWAFPPLPKQVRNWNQALRGHYQVLSRLLAFGDLSKAPAPKPRQA